jgi:DNA helicase HerA-like ATPase
MRVQPTFSGELLRMLPTAVEPPQGMLKGKVYLGWTRIQKKLVFWDWEKLVNPHIVAFGKSGMGKSTFVKKLLHVLRALHSVNAVIIDFSGEYADYADVNLQLGVRDFLNLLDLGKLTPRERIEQVLHAFDTAFNLKEAPLQYILLSEFLEEAYRRKGFDLDKYEEKREPPTLLDVYDIAVEKYEEEREKFRRSEGRSSSFESLIAKIRFYALHSSGAFSKPSTVRLDEITSRGVINFDLSKLPDEEARIVVGMSILEYLIDRMRKEGEAQGIKLIIVLDEAHKLAGEKSPLIPLVKEGRKYGFMIVVSTQDVADVDRRVISNAGSLFIFKLRSPEDIDYLGRAVNMSDYFKEMLHKFEVGQCLVSYDFRRGQANMFAFYVEPELLRRVEVVFEAPELPLV